MRHRTVGDLMTSSVVRVPADAPFKAVVKLLSEHDITAVPVVDDGDRPVGVVSEADLLRRQSGRPDPAGRARSATSAAGLMSSPAVVARPEWTVVQAARVMDTRGIKRLPVVDETGRLVGIVSRADLLRVFLRRDRAIREEISGEVLARTLGITPAEVQVDVTDGQVTLHGTVERVSLIPVVLRLCQGVDGVVRVTEDLDYRYDDSLASPAGVERGPVL
ncbi:MULTISPECIES: CBS domain-containing protein [unclassified Streptomyces]|uniref:CBS domain-containing protein n=1 Tax=unclassified Streptomyces TaxID=2593676 RepID=UPI002E2917CE|nr:CBS domain-containing protein [Streptomyces sp. NBC_00223]